MKFYKDGPEDIQITALENFGTKTNFSLYERITGASIGINSFSSVQLHEMYAVGKLSVR